LPRAGVNRILAPPPDPGAVVRYPHVSSDALSHKAICVHLEVRCLAVVGAAFKDFRMEIPPLRVNFRECSQDHV
jgi:hypothetical protein